MNEFSVLKKYNFKSQKLDGSVGKRLVVKVSGPWFRSPGPV